MLLGCMACNTDFHACILDVVKLVISLVNAPPVVTVVEVEISSVTDVGVWVTWHEIVLLMSNPLFMRMSIPSSLK